MPDIEAYDRIGVAHRHRVLVELIFFCHILFAKHLRARCPIEDLVIEGEAFHSQEIGRLSILPNVQQIAAVEVGWHERITAAVRKEDSEFLKVYIERWYHVTSDNFVRVGRGCSTTNIGQVYSRNSFAVVVLGPKQISATKE